MIKNPVPLHYLSPIELLYGIENLKGDGWKNEEILDWVITMSEDSAKRLLSNNGIEPDFENYGLPKDDPTISDYERKQFERVEWINEAGHFKDSSDPDVSAAANALLELSELRYLVQEKRNDDALISLALGLSLVLSHRETHFDCQDNETKTKLINKLNESLRKRHLNKSSNGGKGKKGYEGPLKRFVRIALDEFGLLEREAKFAALTIMENVSNCADVDFENRPIEVIESTHERLTFRELGSKDGKPKTVTRKRIEDTIREIQQKSGIAAIPEK